MHPVRSRHRFPAALALALALGAGGLAPAATAAPAAPAAGDVPGAGVTASSGVALGDMPMAPKARRLVAKLRPDDAGDPDGFGRAAVRLVKQRGKVCARISYSNLDEPVAAHIHRGRKGVNGPVVVDLSGAVTGGDRCTTGVRKRLIARIIDHPRRFYVNVHTTTYPDGAIRGQLRRP